MSNEEVLFEETETTFHLRNFVNQILHGSDEHKIWLLLSVNNYINGLPLDYNNPYKQ